YVIIQFFFCFFFQAEDGIRDRNVTGVQTCALPICTTLPFVQFLILYKRFFSTGFSHKELPRLGNFLIIDCSIMTHYFTPKPKALFSLAKLYALSMCLKVSLSSRLSLSLNSSKSVINSVITASKK